jgi:hypothetical protein
MQIRSFVAGVAAGLVLGGVAWAGHDVAEGSRYFVHGGPYRVYPQASLERARAEFDQEKASLEEKRRRDPFSPRDITYELIEQRCESRVLDAIGP